MDNLFNATKILNISIINLIDNEYIYKRGQIEYEDGYFFDQLCGLTEIPNVYDGWIFKSNFRRYLNDTYNLTSEEYYNLIMYGDKNHVTMCSYPGCTERVDFISIQRGYKRGCCDEHSRAIAWMDESRHELQAEVGRKSMKKINENLWYSDDYEDFRKSQSERCSIRMSEYNSDPEFAKKATCSAARSYALNMFDKTCLFYIWTREDYLKIGVSSSIHSIEGKINAFCPDMLIAYEGSTIDLAELEYQIKMNYKSLWGNEFFSRDKFNEFNSMLTDKYREVYKLDRNI